jgi:two-component system chemotaxis response regulator CheY
MNGGMISMDKIISILIVDDSSFSRTMLKKYITFVTDRLDLKTSIMEGKNGAEAVALYDKYKPDLVFMDIIMPEKTGLEALRDIMSMDRDARVIICSSMSQSAYVNEAIRLRVFDFIVKPYNDKMGVIADVFKRCRFK